MLEATGFHLDGRRYDMADIGLYLLSLSPNAARDAPWTLVFALGSEHYECLHDGMATKLSRRGEPAYHFWCTDTAMVTELTCYTDGRPAWSVAISPDHDSRPGVAGTPPGWVRAILDERELQQTEADLAKERVDHLYDATADIGYALMGFRHDHDPVTDHPEPFQLLRAY